MKYEETAIHPFMMSTQMGRESYARTGRVWKGDGGGIKTIMTYAVK